MDWLNEPPHWAQHGDTLTVTSGPNTDFWRTTHSGAIADNGHFAFKEVRGDFEAAVTVIGDYNALYDQAGLMLRADAERWLKCGIEYVDGKQFVSAVVTRDTSDWSMVPLAAPPAALTLRLLRHGATVEVYHTLPGAAEQMLRQTWLPLDAVVQVGPMCASPTGAGFQTRFVDFALTQR